MNRLDGKVALISGAARGIGAETTRQMCAVGAHVIIGDILEEAGQRTCDEINNSGGSAAFAKLDVTSETDWHAAIEAAKNNFGKLDILVNNAGLFLGKSIQEATVEEWNRLVSVNMTGVFLGTKLGTPALREAGADSPEGSAIVNLSSIAGLVGAPLDPLYAMTKGGVTLFTKSQALVFAHSGDRIRMNAVHPGVIDTDMGQQTIDVRARNAHDNNQEPALREAIRRHPMGRLGTVDDIAKAIIFLASDDAAFMTGSSLVADGGLTAA